MARPKGTIQELDIKKYWLPYGIALSIDNSHRIRQGDVIKFIDEEYGEFFSSFKAIQRAKYSTHPTAVQKRRSNTNIKKYGVSNPSIIPGSRQKAQETMLKKFGVRHACQNEDIKQKVINTTKHRYGVSNVMKSNDIQQKLEDSNLKKFGVKNAMQSEIVQEALKNSMMKKYGVDNAFKSLEIQQKIKDNWKGGGYHSKPEQEIGEFIASLGLEWKNGWINSTERRNLDIFIPSKNIAIEYNGLYWHSELNKPKHYHLEKTELAEKEGIRIIHIFEHEWNERKNQVKSYLQSALGVNKNIVYARKTEIRHVDKKEAAEFLNQYHILGKCGMKDAFGLYYENELLAMITINIHHRQSKKYVLNRYVGKTNYNVIGGLSRLVKTAVKKYGSLLTWVDRRISDGTNWEKSGWIKEDVLKPDYFYYNPNGNKVISKQMRKKNLVKTPKNMTEKEHAKIDGLLRVWDCGKIRLKYV